MLVIIIVVVIIIIMYYNRVVCRGVTVIIDINISVISSLILSIAERMVSELIAVLGSQPAGYVSHKPGGRLPLLPARPAVTLATLKRAVTDFAAW